MSFSLLSSFYFSSFFFLYLPLSSFSPAKNSNSVDNCFKTLHNNTEKVSMAAYKNINTIISILREQKAYLKKTYKINEIGVFGSFVRGVGKARKRLK
jgi:hypothetical protein